MYNGTSLTGGGGRWHGNGPRERGSTDFRAGGDASRHPALDGNKGFTVLSPQLLRSPFSGVDASALSAVEWKQIGYWRPQTVGAVLFNSWD